MQWINVIFCDRVKTQGNIQLIVGSSLYRENGWKSRGYLICVEFWIYTCRLMIRVICN